MHQRKAARGGAHAPGHRRQRARRTRHGWHGAPHRVAQQCPRRAPPQSPLKTTASASSRSPPASTTPRPRPRSTEDLLHVRAIAQPRAMRARRRQPAPARPRACRPAPARRRPARRAPPASAWPAPRAATSRSTSHSDRTAAAVADRGSSAPSADQSVCQRRGAHSASRLPSPTRHASPAGVGLCASMKGCLQRAVDRAAAARRRGDSRRLRPLRRTPRSPRPSARCRRAGRAGRRRARRAAPGCRQAQVRRRSSSRSPASRAARRRSSAS